MTPGAAPPAIVKGRLAFQHDVDLPVEAPDRAQQYPLGAVIGRDPPVRRGPELLVPPRTDEQEIAHLGPARGHAPGRLQDHGARQVPATGRNIQVCRSEPEPASVAVQHRGEDARPVHPRQAQPLDVAARRHESRDLAIGKESVLRDGRERAPARRRMRSVRQRARHSLRAPLRTARHRAVRHHPRAYAQLARPGATAYRSCYRQPVHTLVTGEQSRGWRSGMDGKADPPYLAHTGSSVASTKLRCDE